MQLRIPKTDLVHAEAFLTMPKTARDEFVSLVKDAPVCSSLDDLKQGVLESAPSTEGLLKVLSALQLTRLAAGETRETVVQAFLDAAAKELPAVELEAAQWDDVRQSLAKALESTALYAATKATHLMRESKNPYAEAKILTDIRPVFTENDATTPLGVGIVHTLKINHLGAGDSLFVSMTRVDLEDLATTISRALQKEASLKASLEKSDWRLFGGTE